MNIISFFFSFFYKKYRSYRRGGFYLAPQICAGTANTLRPQIHRTRPRSRPRSVPQLQQNSPRSSFLSSFYLLFYLFFFFLLFLLLFSICISLSLSFLFSLFFFISLSRGRINLDLERGSIDMALMEKKKKKKKNNSGVSWERISCQELQEGIEMSRISGTVFVPYESKRELRIYSLH